MDQEQILIDDSSSKTLLKKQNFDVIILTAYLSYIVPLVGLLLIYIVDIPVVSANVFTVVVLFSFLSAIVQMGGLLTYLGNFENAAKAQYFLKYLIAVFVLLFFVFLASAFIGLLVEFYSLLICFIPLLIVGWRLLQLTKRGYDFVGGLFLLGIGMMLSAAIFPLALFIPLLMILVFRKAKKYSGQFGFAEQ